MKIETPISVGELFDKLTILDIKLAKISNPSLLNYVKKEKELLEKLFVNFSHLKDLRDDLYAVNLDLWGVEDSIRIKEKNLEFDAYFIELARSVYRLNDARFEIKNKINNILDSEIREVKSYESYS
jgi:asparagine synthetase A